MKKPKCLKQWQLLIKKQISSINRNPFTELIIYCSLEKIRKEYGKIRVGEVMEKLNLRKLGFKLKDQSL